VVVELKDQTLREVLLVLAVEELVVEEKLLQLLELQTVEEAVVVMETLKAVKQEVQELLYCVMLQQLNKLQAEI
jgi:hypothetical protein